MKAATAGWNARDAVMITRGGEPDRRVIYVNSAFCTLTGFKADEVIGEDGDLLLSDGSLQMYSPAGLHAASNGHDLHWIAQLKHRDGSAFRAEAHLTPVYGAEGRTTHFIIVLVDLAKSPAALLQTQPSLPAGKGATLPACAELRVSASPAPATAE